MPSTVEYRTLGKAGLKVSVPIVSRMTDGEIPTVVHLFTLL